MEKLEGFELSVGVTRKLMNITGVWPGTPSNISWHRRYQFLVPLFLLIFFLNIPQTYMLFIVWNNFAVVIEILCTGDLIFGLTCFKLLGIWYKKVDLNYILIKMAEDWQKTEKEKLEVMWTNAKISNLAITSYLTLAIVTVIIYGTQMLVLARSMSTMPDNNETTYKQLLLVSKFPFNTDVRPVYEMIWIFQFVSIIMAGLVFTSFDGFFIFSILHLCGQLMNLRTDVKHLHILYQTTHRTFADLLRKIVERHIQLNRFTNCIENSFNKVLLIQMLGFSVTFCLQGYQFVEILTGNQDSNMGVLIYIISFTITTTSSIFFLFFYCLTVERLKDESLKFSYSFYDIYWYNLKSYDSRMLINIAHATRNPPRITAGKFFDFSFDYFMTLMKTSLGYLSMLLAVKKRFQE